MRATISTEKPPAEQRQDRIVLVIDRPQWPKDGQERPNIVRRHFLSYAEAEDVYIKVGQALAAEGRKLPEVRP
jgi:hypothetical protein